MERAGEDGLPGGIPALDPYLGQVPGQGLLQPLTQSFRRIDDDLEPLPVPFLEPAPEMQEYLVKQVCRLPDGQLLCRAQVSTPPEAEGNGLECGRRVVEIETEMLSMGSLHEPGSFRLGEWTGGLRWVPSLASR